jgi:hypothetical protein
MLPLATAHIALLLATGPASSTAPRPGKGLSKAEVYGVVKSHSIAVKDCYAGALAKDSMLSGTVVLAWTVETDGRVAKVRVASTTMNNSEVENCIVGEVERWTFPRSSGTTSVAEFPFVFKNRPPDKAPADAGSSSLSNMTLQLSVVLPRSARADARS